MRNKLSTSHNALIEMLAILDKSPKIRLDQDTLDRVFAYARKSIAMKHFDQLALCCKRLSEQPMSPREREEVNFWWELIQQREVPSSLRDATATDIRNTLEMTQPRQRKQRKERVDQHKEDEKPLDALNKKEKANPVDEINGPLNMLRKHPSMWTELFQNNLQPFLDAKTKEELVAAATRLGTVIATQTTKLNMRIGENQKFVEKTLQPCCRLLMVRICLKRADLNVELPTMINALFAAFTTLQPKAEEGLDEESDADFYKQRSQDRVKPSKNRRKKSA